MYKRQVQGILLTHEHSDHIQGLNVLCNRHKIPIYCNRGTKDAVEDKFKGYNNYRLFSTGSAFEIGDVNVENFSIPHDAADPVGFALSSGGLKVGFLTDLGFATRLILERVRNADVLVLEANHDLKLVQEDTKRPWALKQRILSRHGHLSNDSAAAVAMEVMSDRLRHLYLGHLSKECNRPELAFDRVSQAVNEIGARHCNVYLTSQDDICSTISLNS